MLSAQSLVPYSVCVCVCVSCCSYEVDIYEARQWIGGKVASFVDKNGNHIEASGYYLLTLRLGYTVSPDCNHPESPTAILYQQMFTAFIPAFIHHAGGGHLIIFSHKG